MCQRAAGPLDFNTACSVFAVPRHRSGQSRLDATNRRIANGEMSPARYVCISSAHVWRVTLPPAYPPWRRAAVRPRSLVKVPAPGCPGGLAGPRKRGADEASVSYHRPSVMSTRVLTGARATRRCGRWQRPFSEALRHIIRDGTLCQGCGGGKMRFAGWKVPHCWSRWPDLAHDKDNIRR
jgi:hypothetical protein